MTIDASFISLKILLPVVKGWFAPAPLRSYPHSLSDGEGHRRGEGGGSPHQAPI